MRSTSELTHMHSSSTHRRAFGATSQRSSTPSTAARNALPLAGVNSHGKSVIGIGPGAMAREKQFGELRRERPRRPGVRQIGGIGFVAAIGGIRHRAARGVEQALDLVPLRRGVDSGADARHLDALVDDFPFREPLDLDAIRLARGESVEALAALLARRGLHDRDAAHGLPARQRLADEEVDMRLQEAAGAELEDRERGQDPRSR